MPAEKLPELVVFTGGVGAPMFLDGEPTEVIAGARKYSNFARDCVAAAATLRGLDSSGFEGVEADRFREKLDGRLPGWLQTAGEAYGAVGRAVSVFGTEFSSDHGRIRSIRAQAGPAHTAVQLAAELIGSLEKRLVGERSAEAVAHADHAASVSAATAGAVTPAGPALAAKEAEALTVANAATAKVKQTEGELAAAWVEYRRARGVWDGLLGDANAIQDRMHEAAVAAQRIIDDQKGLRFSENPSGISGFFSSIGNWLDDHADLLKLISEILVTVGSIVAMFPGIGTALGAVLVGVGLVMKLALTINGNMSWGEFAMSALDAVPGAGKAAQVGKLAKLRRVCANDPVDVFSGDVVDSEVDFRIGGVFPFVFERGLMTSFRAGRSFGPSWVSVFDSCVEVTESGVV